MALIGIDLGTTFCAVASLDDRGKPLTVPNRDGACSSRSATRTALPENDRHPPRKPAATSNNMGKVFMLLPESFRETSDSSHGSPISDLLVSD